MPTKSELRKQIASRLKSMTLREGQQESTALCERLAAFPEVMDAGTIGAYLSLQDEPDLTPFLRDRHAAGARIAIPAPGEDGVWRFRGLRAFEPLTPGPLGLSFPPLGETLPAERLDLVLVPGRAFTREGVRLGRGQGIYDRLLAGSSVPHFGVAFSLQVVDTLPEEPHDIRMTRVITPLAGREGGPRR